MVVVQIGDESHPIPIRTESTLKNKSKIRTRTETKPVKAKDTEKKTRDPGRLRFFGMIRNEG